jgi:lipopolysaccharide/colanic/teichoic acid biosynthesis glycosyltransferase/glycosyltransferase involved in cell wall biosynthesis
MISVIIPAFNSARTLPACLQALGCQTHPADEIIVVDDGSADDTLELARQMGARVLQQAHQGPAAARNLGAQQAQGDLLLFTDSDCEPLPDWVDQLISPFGDALVVGAKGTYRCREGGLVARLVQQEYESKYARMLGLDTIDFIDTYSAAYRKDVFLQNGGFDPAFPVPSVEDQEFSFRLARKGYRLVFAPLASVYHCHDQDLGEYLRRKFGIGYWKAFMLRWLPEKAFSDSHTLPSQRWQILLLGSAIGLACLGWFWRPAFWFSLLSVLIFFATTIPFLSQITRNDRSLLWAAPGILLARAMALGLGLLVGFLFAPARQSRSPGGLHIVERFIKRLMDVIFGFLGLILSSPILALAMIAIRVDSPGPVFFVQTRCGENGKPFRIVKLRTMQNGAEEQVQQVIARNMLKGPVFKIIDDPRTTRVGKFLRRWSIDELPQFWNVLLGDMSLVGPRPEEAWVVEQYNDQQRQRLIVKPGLTGPMQVYGRSDLDFDARLALDLDYIQHYSLVKDIRILCRTIPVVISGKGAY